MTQKYEIGSQWETETGHAVVVESDDKKLITYQKHKDWSGLSYHNKDGSHKGSLQRTKYDLLRPWVEKRSGWVNVYEESSAGGHAEVFDTQEQALSKANAAFTLLACVKWTEGDGV